MIPEELAERHPQLYHVTQPGAWESIKKIGLLSTTCLLDLYGIKGEPRDAIEARRRSTEVPLEHPQHGRIIINDNVSLSEHALANCLDDQLTPTDWLRLLNTRVFFWASKEGLSGLLNARLNRTRQREVIVVDTLSLAKAHAKRMELCPINSGATLRKPARRGLQTFTPLLTYTFKEWSHLRGGRDQIREVIVQNQVLDIASHTVDILQTPLNLA